MKRIWLLFLFLSLPVLPLFSAESFNFDDQAEVDLRDLIYFISWIQSGYSTNPETIVGRAKEIYPDAQGPLVRRPDNSKDDLNGDGIADLKDMIMMIAWIQASKTNNFSTIEARALEILSNAGRLSKLPGTPIGDSSFSTTITGIQTD